MVFVENAVVGARIRVGIPEIGPAGAQRGQVDVVQLDLLPRLGSQSLDIPARDKTVTWACKTRLRAGVLVLLKSFSISEFAHQLKHY